MSARTGNQLTHGRPRMKAKAVKSEFARLFVQGMTPMPKLSEGLDVWSDAYFEDRQDRADWWCAEERRTGSKPDLSQMPRKVWHTVDDLLSMEPVDWLIDGLVPRRGLAYLIGRDGVKKTFIALDMALCIVAGRPFHGHDVGWFSDSNVLFIAGEGAHSFGSRITAWCDHNGVTLDSRQKDRLLVRSSAVNLYATNEDFEQLLEMVAEREPDLIVIDTLQRSSAGAESNSARDMGMVTERADQIKRASNGGTVLVIAHTAKADLDTRGSSSIEDDADAVLHVKDKGGLVDIEVTKMKDGRSGDHLVLCAVGAAGSIALAVPGPAVADPLWSSSSPRSRVIGALRVLLPKGPATQTEIRDVCITDVTGTDVNRGTISREIAKLVTEGAVVAHGKSYLLVEGWVETTDREATP